MPLTETLVSDEFDDIIEAVLEGLEPEARHHLSNIAIIVQPEQEGDDVHCGTPTALGLFKGEPLTRRRWWSSYQLEPSEIKLFEGPIRRYAAKGHDLESVIQDVILHELGHYFGLTHAEMGAYCQV